MTLTIEWIHYATLLADDGSPVGGLGRTGCLVRFHGHAHEGDRVASGEVYTSPIYISRGGGSGLATKPSFPDGASEVEEAASLMRHAIELGIRDGATLNAIAETRICRVNQPTISHKIEAAARSGSDEKKLQLGIPPMYICRRWNESTTDAWINFRHELVKQDSELLLQLFGEFMQALHLDPLTEPAQRPTRLDRFDRGLLLVGVPLVL